MYSRCSYVNFKKILTLPHKKIKHFEPRRYEESKDYEGYEITYYLFVSFVFLRDLRGSKCFSILSLFNFVFYFSFPTLRIISTTVSADFIKDSTGRNSYLP